MKNCKDHLSYKKIDNGELDDIALPFLTSLKVYTVKPPSLGYYITKLLQSFTIITFIFRCIDGVTDFTLTATYLTNWKQVVNDSFAQTIPYNSNQTMTEMCERERNKVACIIPNLEYWWLPGMFSAIVLFITWLAEVISIVKYVREGKAHFVHFCEVFSRSCCKKHMSIPVYTFAIVLPLTQQVSSLIYEHWLNTFVLYWKEKSQ